MALLALLAAVLVGAVGAWALGTGPRERVLVAATIGLCALMTVYGLLGYVGARRSQPAGHDPDRSPTPLRVARDGGKPPIEVARGYLWARLATPGRAAYLLVLAGAGLAGLGWLARRRRRAIPAFAVETAVPRWQRLLVAGSLASLAIGAVSALGPARGYDALWYHLPLAIAFAQRADLAPPSDEIVAFFPGNGELWQSLWLSLFGPRAINLAQLPFALLLAICAAHLASASGLGRARGLVAAIVLAVPLVVFQSTTAYVDLFASAMLVASATFLVRYAATLVRAYLVLGGLAAGVALGAKYAAIPLTAALGLMALLAGLGLSGVNRRRPSSTRLRRVGSALLAGAIFVLCTLPPSVFWYWRNARLSGNPVFPITLAIGKRELAGIAPSSGFNPLKERQFVAGSRWGWLWQPFRESYSVESGLGAPLVAAAPAALLLVLIASGRALVRRRHLPLAALPAIGALTMIALWASASAREPRHLLPALGLLAPLIGVLLLRERVASRLRPWIVGALVATQLVTLRTLLFSHSHEQGPTLGKDASTYHGLPRDYAALVPGGAVVENRAGPTYNFALHGPRFDILVRPHVSSQPPSLEVLRYHGVRFVFYRGPAGKERYPGRRLLSERVGSHRWWDGSPDDVIELYELPWTPPRRK